MFRGVIKEKIVGKQGSKYIRIQLIDDDWAKYCVQYCGNGHYFQTFEETRGYVYGRFGIKIEPLEDEKDGTER